MLRKVRMLPTPKEASRDTTNSINQIVLRLEKLLPQFGWELVERDEPADIVAAHAGQSGGIIDCDVAHCHGLYPTAEHSNKKAWFAINVNVIENLRKARKITVPSQWVGDIIRRNLSVEPEVIPWAVESTEWSNAVHQGYTLWNKTRPDVVCDPLYVKLLAEVITNANFKTTFYPEDAPPLLNVDIVGRQSYPEMSKTIRGASIYLATTKETFGIGILEAMACKIPILGFNWGAVPDYVTHGVEGYLANPGDIQGLIDGWHYCIAHRQILGENAQQKASEFTWEYTAKQFAKLYDEVFREKHVDPPIHVSVVIPSYNYANYVTEAIESVLAQKTDLRMELIIVDDGSTDNTKEILDGYSKSYHENNPNQYHPVQRLKIITQENQGVSAARNNGINAAAAEYIICLDADDLFGSDKFVEILYNGIQSDPSLGIVYTGLGVLNGEDSTQYNHSNWPGKCDPDAHFRGHNQIPTCNMFRKEAWRRANGYKFYAEPSEDGELWARILTLGYKAQQVTGEAIFYYRWHSASLSNDIRSGVIQPINWLYFHSWAKTGIYPFAAVTTAAKRSHPVDNYDNPQVSIIIPVGPAHIIHLKRALDSVMSQTFTSWECIVINDTGQDLSEHIYPWVKLIEPLGQKFKNVAQIRNIGVEHSQAPLLTFLDADDYFDPTYLEKTYKYYSRFNRYIYTDWVSLKTDSTRELGRASEYDTAKVFNSHILHTINILIPRTWFETVGGFDESLDTWEDVELFMKLAAKGLCGKRFPEALTFYDYGSGNLREYALTKEDVLKTYLTTKYEKYMGENAEMCECVDPKPDMTVQELMQAAVSGEMIRVTYQGAKAKHSVVGPVTKQAYGRRQAGDIFYIWLEDYTSLKRLFQPAPLIREAFLRKTEFPNNPTLQRQNL